MYGIHWRVWFPWYEWEHGVGFDYDITDEIKFECLSGDIYLERLLDGYAFY